MARVIDCPKCGVSQPEDVFCASCGVRIKTFQAQTRSSKTKESLIISAVAVLFLGLGIYFVQKTVRNTFNLVATGDEIQIEDDTQPGPSPVTQQGYRRQNQNSDEQYDDSGSAALTESVQTTGDQADAAVVVKPLQSIRVQIQKLTSESLQSLTGEQPSTNNNSQLNIVKTAAAPKGSSSFPIDESQGWPVRIEEPLTVQAAQLGSIIANNDNDPDGLFLSISKVEESPNSLVLEGEIKISTLLASGPARIQIRREFELATDETAVLHSFMPREAIKPNMKVDTVSPFSVLQDPSFLANASDIVIFIEGVESSPSNP